MHEPREAEITWSNPFLYDFSLSHDCPGPLAAKQGQPSSLYHCAHHWHNWCLCRYAVWFPPNVLLCITLKHLIFGPKDTGTEVWSFVQVQLREPKLWCCSFYREEDFNPSKQAQLVKSFSNGTIINFNMLPDTCRVWDVLWVFHGLRLGWHRVVSCKDWQLYWMSSNCK